MNNADVRRIRFQDLRHTHGSLLIQAGVPIKVISHGPRDVRGDRADIGMPSEHRDFADQVLSRVGLTDDALQQATTTEVPMSLGS